MKGEPLDKRLVLGALWLICDAIVHMLGAYPVPTPDDARALMESGQIAESMIAQQRHDHQQQAIRQINKVKWLIERLASRHGYSVDERTLTHL